MSLPTSPRSKNTSYALNPIIQNGSGFLQARSKTRETVKLHNPK